VNTTSYGAAKTVTSVQHIMETKRNRILLKCGLFQGKRKVAFKVKRKGICNGRTVGALVLSHARIDHFGNIPC